MVKRSLVLSGGGSKGSYQVGVLKAMAEHGLSWDTVHGISVGALNASWIAMHKKEDHPMCIQGLIDIWSAIQSSADIYKPWLPFGLNYISSMWKGSLNTGRPLRKLVEKNWKAEAIADSCVKLSVGCCSLSTTEYKAIHSTHVHGPDLLSYVLASSHMPIIFEPIAIDNQYWIDGGMRHQIPILEALQENPDIIDIILTSPVSSKCIESRKPMSSKSAPSVAIRGLQTFSDQIFMNDWQNIQNLITKRIPNNIVINVYAPACTVITDSMNFAKDMIAHGIHLGYTDAMAILGQ